jgi:germination protein YpeB
VEDLNHSLEKSLYISSPSLRVSVFSELYSESREAAACLGMLPFSSAEFEKTSAFVSRVGDYCYTLSKKTAGGEKLSPEDAENLKALSRSAGELASQLVDLQSKVFSDGLKIDSLALDEARERMRRLVTVSRLLKTILWSRRPLSTTDRFQSI